MINVISGVAKKFFGFKETVDSVTNIFSKAIDDLKKVEQQERDNAYAQYEAIEKAKIDHDASVREAARAGTIASKLSELVGQARA